MLKIKQYLTILLLFAAFLTFAPVSRFSSASLLDKLDSQITETQKQIQKSEKRVNEYKKKISQSQKQIKSLKDQLNILQTEVKELQTQIELTQMQIKETSLEILKKQYQIEEKNREIIHKKEVLAEIIRNIYKQNNKGELEVILSSDSFADLFNQLRYTDLVQDQVKAMLIDLQTLKMFLQEQKQNLDNKKQEQENLNKRLITEKINLNNRKQSKNILLTQTNNQEKEYQKLLEQIQAQQESLLSDLGELSAEKQAELERIRALQSKPGSGLASESWYFNQNDPKWKNNKIGISNASVGKYGCAISSLAMLFQYYGIDTDPGILAKEPMFTNRGLIYWPEEWRYLDLVMNRSRKPVDWMRIDQEIKNNHPVIVFIKVGTGNRKGHYVVIHNKDKNGQYVVHDPYYGPNIYLNSTIELLENAYNTSTSLVDQMIIYH